MLEDGDADRASLLRRIAELDQGREQALVTIEDGQERILALIDERGAMEAELAAQRARIADLCDRLAASEAAHTELERRVTERTAELAAANAALRAREEQLCVAKEMAEAADRAKTRFLAAASHDLRQPIQAASLYTYVLQSSIPADNAEGAEVLDLLKASIESLSAMLSGLLDLSRLEAGAVEVSIANILPGAMMNRLAAEFAELAEAYGVTLRFLPSTAAIATDPRLFERALRNLIANAIAHGRREDGGRVLVGARRRRNGVEFQVWDTGPGIPECAREAIFEEFRQLHNPARSATQGFGIGLSIVNRIARLLKLEVSVRSQVGRGTVFSILVPQATGPNVTRRAATPAETAIASCLRGRNILLVEDDEQVDAVSSTEELAAKLPRLRRRPHAVLTDYRLPGGGTGRKVVELVRSRWDVPGIIITGDTAPERLREAMSIGCRLLHKPIEPSELMGALGEAMHGDGAAAPARPATRSRRAGPEA